MEIENIFTSLSQPGSQGKILLNLGKLQPCCLTLVGEKTPKLRTYAENLDERPSKHHAWPRRVGALLVRGSREMLTLGNERGFISLLTLFANCSDKGRI